MKKIALYIMAAWCCISCELRGGNPDYYFSASYLEDYAWETMDVNFGQANRLFGILQCADKYLSYTGDDRALQWFSNYVQATEDDGVVKINCYGGDMIAITNGLGFNEPGAICEVEGYTFTCTSETSWTVESIAMDSEIEILSSESTRLMYRWTGNGTDTGKKTDLHADYDFNIVYIWKFSTNPANNYFYKSSDGKRGYFNFLISRQGIDTDWIHCNFVDSKSDTRTSRN